MKSISIHPNDDMFHGSIEHYEAVGAQMADFVSQASELVSNTNPLILELPCGYGRVTRKLVDKYDASLVQVAEILAPALDFVCSSFGVTGYQVVAPVTEFRNIPDSKFDIAVMGSLITHLSEENSKNVIKSFFKKLKMGGVGVVTTTGGKAYDLLLSSESYQNDVVQVGENGRKYLLDCYEKGLFGYAKYSKGHTFEQKTVDIVGDSYGYSLIPKKWVDTICAENSLKILRHLPGGWDNHQDVFFIQK